MNIDVDIGIKILKMLFTKISLPNETINKTI